MRIFNVHTMTIISEIITNILFIEFSKSNYIKRVFLQL